jgi:hypothetical protein
MARNFVNSGQVDDDTWYCLLHEKHALLIFCEFLLQISCEFFCLHVFFQAHTRGLPADHTGPVRLIRYKINCKIDNSLKTNTKQMIL